MRKKLLLGLVLLSLLAMPFLGHAEEIGNTETTDHTCYANCNDTTKCAVCGEAYNGEDIQHPVCSYYNYTNDIYHKKTCPCGLVIGEVGEHTTSEDDPWTCLACGQDLHCEAIGCTYEKKYDPEFHWLECSKCGKISNKANHFTYCTDTSGQCSYCGSNYSPDWILHSGTISYEIDADYHQEVYSCCNQTSEKEEHYSDCDTNGTCNVCKASFTDPDPGHYFDDAVWEHDDTHCWNACRKCSAKVNYQTHFAKCTVDRTTCVNCGLNSSTDNITIDHVAHDSASPLKTDETYHWRVCTYCGDVIRKIEHLPYSSVIEETASYKKYQCSICQYEWTETISTECTHSWSVLSETAASCLTDGSITYKCSLCDETRTETLAASGAHTPAIAYGRSATCTQAGYTDGKRCSVCGEVLEERQQIAQLAHSWQQSSQTAPTCTANGSIVYTCSGCQGTYEESLSAIGHSYGAYQPAGDGTHVSVCANGCGDSKVRSCEFENVTSGLFTYSTCKVCAYTTYSVKEAPAQDETSTDAAATDDVSDETSAADTDAVESSAVESTVSVEAEKAILTLATEIAAAPEAVETVQIADATISVVSMDETAESSESSYIPEGAQLLVHEQSLPEEMTALPGAQMLHIALTVDGETVEHTGKVKVEIPTEQLQDTQDMSAMRLVLIANDGTMIEIPFEIIDGKLVFTTDMLGLFAFVPVEAA